MEVWVATPVERLSQSARVGQPDESKFSIWIATPGGHPPFCVVSLVQMLARASIEEDGRSVAANGIRVFMLPR
jgi:hypothetical protein